MKIISQNTAERKQETIELFHKCKPYLDKGMRLSKAVQKVKKTTHSSFYTKTWYKELKEYAEQQGYAGRR